jgi:ankyrin repeat protein
MLLAAPFMKDMTLIDYFTEKGASIQDMDSDGNSIFSYASKGGNIAFLELLIEAGINPGSQNNHGGNAMIMATQGTRGFQNPLDTYKYLKAKGVEVNAVGKDQKNPLHNLAYRQKDLSILNFFLAHGVSINQPDVDGNTPFMNASGYNNLEVLEYLGPKVANINLKNNEGKTALTMALSRNTTSACEFLLKKGADVNVLDKEGNSLAYYLVTNYSNEEGKNFDEKLSLLKAFGFQIKQLEGKGQTLYHLAVEQNNLELLSKLKDFNLNINAKNNDGLTALHIAAMKAHNQDIMKYLMEEGADKTILTDFDESVYDLAAENELLNKNKIDLSFLK